jgi:hypothetical protein
VFEIPSASHRCSAFADELADSTVDSRALIAALKYLSVMSPSAMIFGAGFQ